MTLRQLRWRLASALYGSAPTRRALPVARRVAFAPVDFAARLRGGPRPWQVPPRKMQFVGAGDYLGAGRHFADLLIEFGGLGPSSSVLDIGSGIGRVAVHVAETIGQDGRYEGFDVSAEGVDWCTREVTSRYPNFRFRRADLRNDRYNPGGADSAESYRFPYDDDSFDIAFAASVFTHMLPAEVDNYLRETRRVLRPGGHLIASWYLLGMEREHAAGAAGSEDAWFPASGDGYRAVSLRAPEFAIAYDAGVTIDRYGSTGLDVDHAMPGSWLGGSGRRAWQDLLVAAA